MWRVRTDAENRGSWQVKGIDKEKVATMSLLHRLWIYQRERFPLVSHSILVLALTIGVSGFASAGAGWPTLARMAGAFVAAMGFFMLLRISDEFKDAADDAAYRPYRPVPRGLVTLRELAGVGVVVIVAQLGITLLLGAALLPYLMAAWLLMALMSQEFFVGKWLRAHPIPYMLSHMFILPLIDFYLLAAAWQGHGAPPVAFGWFLGATYSNGIVFEIGRKVRAAQDEEAGVDTYSALWGVPKATMGWLLAVTSAALAGIAAGWTLGAGVRAASAMTGVMLLGCLGAAWVARQMVREPTTGHSQWVERFSAVWVLTFYLTMGLLPHLL
jgi:4-hydroxybenzoate polyprenyltransferase